MTNSKPACPVCDNEMNLVDLPKRTIYACDSCGELGQVVGGQIQPIGDLLARHELGDDKVMMATSLPHITTVKNFIDIYDNTTRFLQMDLATAAGGLRTVLHMLENRIDSALQCFTGLDMASDDALKGLTALREARELVSTMPQQTRGVRTDDSVDSATSTAE